MFNFKVGIVLYNPEFNSISRILDFSKIGVEFYIFDNSLLSNELLLDKCNINYYTFGKNMGLSYSIDFLCKQCVQDKSDRLLFFDQDTIFNIETLWFVENLNSLIFENLDFKDVLSINFREKIDKLNNYNFIEEVNLNEFKLVSNYFIINSGTLFFLDKYYYFKWFDDRFFVDGVDYSFSLNSILNKFRNLSIFSVPGLNHTDEQGDTTLLVFGKPLTSRMYPIRRNFDFLSAHSLLLLTSFKLKSWKPKVFLLKAIVSYFFTQLIFRSYNSLKTIKRFVY